MASDLEIPLRFEFASREAIFTFLSRMDDTAQSQYIQMLLDFIDDERSGKNGDLYDWMKGHANTRTLDRMKTTTPELYKIIQVDRNKRWAAKIHELLTKGGKDTFFVLVGLNHILGDDGILEMLKREYPACKILRH
jgi:uncharacterized protein